MKANWRTKTDKAVDDAKTKGERQAETRLSAAEAELTAEAERQLATAEAELRAEAEQVSAAAHAQSVEQTDRHPGAVGEGAESNMADEFAELFAQQRAGQTERHTRAGEDEGPEAANDDHKGDKDEKQADEEEGKGGKYGRPWMWAAAATIVVGLFLGPSLMPVLDGVKSKFKPKETLIVQEEVLIVETDMANIRGEASSNSRIIARVAYNSKVTGIKRKGSWVRVITDGAKKPVGWIHSSLLRPQHPDR
ncbi:MAG: SH3 domain-containing protein [Proteobacteria bacterium]|nr:SH3 domain-containing protein [Pseudomonadota bacterium]